MSIPAVYIKLALEQRPEILFDAPGKSVALRLADWLESVEDLSFLVDHVECVCATWDAKRGEP